MKTLSIFRVFLKLKKEEFIKWFKSLTSSDYCLLYFVQLLMLLVFFVMPISIYKIYNTQDINHWYWIIFFIDFVIGVIFVLVNIMIFSFRWLIKFCRDNWQKATKIVDGK
jgi:hypothetical protein